jgi:hypothetical protein
MHTQCRATGAQSLILLTLRCTKKRQHAIAAQLIHDPSECMHGVQHQPYSRAKNRFRVIRRSACDKVR